MLYFFYSILFGAWVVLMTPYFIYNALVNKKYLPSLGERMGRLPNTLRSDGRLTIWFHSCSVGETLSVQPLAHALRERFPHARFVFSVITHTGRRIAEERFKKYGEGCVFYFPIDLPPFVNRVLDIVQPDILVKIDTEIWPNALHACRERRVPVLLANGRISAKSFRSYRWAQPLLGRVFENYRVLLMKSQEDADRIQTMGAPPSKIRISGNIKYDRDVVEKEVTAAQLRALSAALGLDRDGHGPLIVAGSTHENEEETLFAVLKRLRETKGLEKLRLLIAPRHPERFGVVASLAEKRGFPVTRRSAGKSNPKAQVLVLDTLGELATAYQFATVAFVGGTLIPHGGQSIMEPALWGKAIVIGPHMENFPREIEDFLAKEAVLQIPADETQKAQQVDQLVEAFSRLLANEAEREAMGGRAQSIFESSKGATAFTVDQIAALLEERGQK
jgi:3-deoxy-D-manno-octulosonic-acid transferase